MRWRLLQTTATVMAARTDVATAFRRTRRFRSVAVARLGSNEARGQGEAGGESYWTVELYLQRIFAGEQNWAAALRRRKDEDRDDDDRLCVKRGGEEHSVFARSSSGKPTGC